MTDKGDTQDAYTATPDDIARAERFFDRARKVAEASQYDYAIEMYLEGLGYDPGNVQIHNELRNVALMRKGPGKGKPLGSFKAMGLKKTTKDPKQNLLNARKLLAYDPGNATYMESVAKAAAKLGLRDVVVWIGPMLFRALIDAPKQSPDAFNNLKEIYKQVGEYKLAADALSQAAALRPDDSNLQHELRELAAQMTMSEGGYDRKGSSFRDSIRDADKQRELLEEDADIRSVDALQAQINRAREEYQADPSVAGKLIKLVETLSKTGELRYENEAIELLDRAYKQTGNYRWKFNSDEIKLRQFARAGRMLRQAMEADPKDEAAKKEYEAHRREQLQLELEHFQGAMKAYPTDMRFKFEAARRMFELGNYTDAIPVLQQSQNDVKYRDDSRLMLGRSFLRAEFVDEAADTLRNLIDIYQGEGDDRSKEMYYWYGRALEEKGDIDDALKAYSQIAQWDFGYRDVQNRIKTLRGRK